MRELAQRHTADHASIVAAYVEAERGGIVVGKSNSRALSAEDYAARLLADGNKKGWLHE